MPRDPIFKSPTAQRAAISAAMAVVCVASIALSWVVSGASLGNPLAPVRPDALPPPDEGRESRPPPAGGEARWVELDATRFPIPARFEPAQSTGPAADALAGVSYQVWTDPQQPGRRLTAIVLAADEPRPLGAVTERWLRALWSDQLQDPAAPQSFNRGSLRAVELVLVPVSSRRGRVGDLDLIAGATPDQKRFLILHLRDASTEAARTRPLALAGAALLRRIYRNARFEELP